MKTKSVSKGWNLSFLQTKRIFKFFNKGVFDSFYKTTICCWTRIFRIQNRFGSKTRTGLYIFFKLIKFIFYFCFSASEILGVITICATSISAKR
jgi:hypothetical protein